MKNPAQTFLKINNMDIYNIRNRIKISIICVILYSELQIAYLYTLK
jgi:hypothetical protein